MRCPHCDELRQELGTVRADLAAAVEVLREIKAMPYAVYGYDEIRVSKEITTIADAALARMEVKP